MITRKEFEDERFLRDRNTKKQTLILSFLLKNKSNAFKTKEIAKEIYGKDDNGSVAKAYYILVRLQNKGYVEKKLPYWAIKSNDEEKKTKKL
jgi:Fe2+ or Zn2+ uptake regulation protein